jgi:hypothetical protein
MNISYLLHFLLHVYFIMAYITKIAISRLYND